MKSLRLMKVVEIALLLFLLLATNHTQAQYYLGNLTSSSSPLSIISVRGSGWQFGAYATIQNQSSQAQDLRHNRGTGVVASSSGQGFGKPHPGNIRDNLVVDRFYPWLIKPYYDYEIPPNSTVEIPLYVLCQNVYKSIWDPDSTILDFSFYTLSDSVMQLYEGVDKVNGYLMDSLSTKIWIHGNSYIFYQGTLIESDHGLIQTGHWVADSSEYIMYDNERYYGVDSLYLDPWYVNWAMWVVTDDIDSSDVRIILESWGASPTSEYLQLIYCCVYSILWAAEYYDLAERFYQPWCETDVDVENHAISIPTDCTLRQNYPNPFNSETVIEYQLPRSSPVTLEIYDMLGRKVETLIHGKEGSGLHRILWDASRFSSGMYVYRLRFGNEVMTRKCLLLK